MNKFKVLIINELKILINKLINLLKSNKKNIIYLLFIFFIIFFYFILFFIPTVLIIFILNILIIFILYINKKNYVFSYYTIIIKYTPKPKNFILYFLYTYLIRQPLVYGYIITYSILYFFFNKKNIKLDTDKIIILSFRYLFKYTVGIPYFIIEKTIEVTETFSYLKDFKYENRNAFWYNFLLNLANMYSIDIKVLRDSKIILSKESKITFNPKNQLKLIESIEDFLKLNNYLPKISRIIYGKLGDSDLYPRYYILFEINPEVTTEKFDTLAFSVSKHPEWKINIECDEFDLKIKKAYQTNYVKMESLESILKKKFDSEGMSSFIKIKETPDITENWITDAILTHKKEFVLTEPFWSEVVINITDLSHDIFYTNLIKMILISSSTILAKFSDNKIIINMDEKPFLYKYTLINKIFKDNKLNLSYENVVKSYHNFITEQKKEKLITSDWEGWLKYKQFLYNFTEKHNYLAEIKQKLKNLENKKVEELITEPPLSKKLKITENFEEQKTDTLSNKTKAILPDKFNIDND